VILTIHPAPVEKGREVEATDPRSSRLALVAAAGAIAANSLLGRLIRPGDALAASPSKAQDVRILQLVLQLEYTQVAFYELALRAASLQGQLREFARAALAHERAHLAALRSALGAKAAPRPRFDLRRATKDPATFRKTAIELEDLAVAGYNGQATNLTPGTLAVAATIVSVEARHASWVRALAGEVAAPEPVDKPMTAKQVVDGLHKIGLKA
jgi:rubrerythrin